MKIFVTGNDGQLDLSLLELAQNLPNVDLVAVGRPRLDLADPGSVAKAIADEAPDLVISAAAYTAVDLAEDEPDLAHAINAEGAGAVAEAAAKAGAPIIHISTDYVFSGQKTTSYREDDVPDPASVYGRTKLAGELAVVAANPRHLIVRTAWVYSPFAKNFVKTMLHLARDRDEINVVADQFGSPTSALDIADGILHIAARGEETSWGLPFGTYHLVGTGSTSWAGLAAHALAASKKAGGPSARISEISTAQYSTKALRPKNSRLATEKLWDAFGWRAPEWQKSVATTVQRLLVENNG